MQTQARKRWEQQQQQADDDASARSEANPVPLSSLDDSLFGNSKARHKFTRSQKRVQAKEHISPPHKRSHDALTMVDTQQLKTAHPPYSLCVRAPVLEKVPTLLSMASCVARDKMSGVGKCFDL